MYLLLITNKQSNILEDLETLRLLGKLVPEFSQSLEEEAVAGRAFDLIFAFDEVISLGHKENITVQQVKQNCEMESHEEKLHKLIIQSKINDTKDIMKKKAADIEKSKLEQKKVGLGSALTGFGSKASSLMADLEGPPAYRPDPVPVISSSRPAAAPTGPKGPSKGMQLGKTKKANDFLESLAKEGEVVELEVPKPAGGVAAVTANLSADPVSLAIEEKLSVALNKQGGVENIEVQVRCQRRGMQRMWEGIGPEAQQRRQQQQLEQQGVRGRQSHGPDALCWQALKCMAGSSPCNGCTESVRHRSGAQLGLRGRYITGVCRCQRRLAVRHKPYGGEWAWGGDPSRQRQYALAITSFVAHSLCLGEACQYGRQLWYCAVALLREAPIGTLLACML